MEHAGDLVVNAGNLEYAESLTSVGGGLSVRAKGVQLPALTSVGGSLYVDAEGVQLPALTSVGGYQIVAGKQQRENLKTVAGLALASELSLDMTEWHVCETTHCIAGWAAHAIEAAKEIERKTGSTSIAGTVVLGVEAAKHFHVSNQRAREFLTQYL